jgi:hypothetical protein
MKPHVSQEARHQVLALRRTQSIRDVAQRTGLPVGTIKTICHRSGAFHDNQKLRDLFKLPEIKASQQTLPATLELPPQLAVTGDKEIDAVLWLRQVIGTGQAALIDKAMLAVKKIKTPLEEVEKRYRDYMVSAHPGNFMAALASFGFADLEGLAKKSTRKLTLSNEAMTRFGTVESLYADTPAELFCIETLKGVNLASHGGIDDDDADKRFQACPELMPHTIGDCLYELAYWSDLYALRNASGDCGDGPQEASARDWFVFRCLARIRPRTREEALAAFHYLADSERMDIGDTDAILLNLIG